MARDDDDPFGSRLRPKPPVHEIGQALDTLSVDELAERIALLRVEIERLDRGRSAKAVAGEAADAVFRRSS